MEDQIYDDSPEACSLIPLVLSAPRSSFRFSPLEPEELYFLHDGRFIPLWRGLAPQGVIDSPSPLAPPAARVSHTSPNSGRRDILGKNRAGVFAKNHQATKLSEAIQLFAGPILYLFDAVPATPHWAENWAFRHDETNRLHCQNAQGNYVLVNPRTGESGLRVLSYSHLTSATEGCVRLPDSKIAVLRGYQNGDAIVSVATQTKRVRQDLVHRIPDEEDLIPGIGEWVQFGNVRYEIEGIHDAYITLRDEELKGWYVHRAHWIAFMLEAREHARDMQLEKPEETPMTAPYSDPIKTYENYDDIPHVVTATAANFGLSQGVRPVCVPGSSDWPLLTSRLIDNDPYFPAGSLVFQETPDGKRCVLVRGTFQDRALVTWDAGMALVDRSLLLHLPKISWNNMIQTDRGWRDTPLDICKPRPEHVLTDLPRCMVVGGRYVPVTSIFTYLMNANSIKLEENIMVQSASTNTINNADVPSPEAIKPSARMRKQLRDQGIDIAKAMGQGVALSGIDQISNGFLALAKRIVKGSPMLMAALDDPQGAEFAKALLAVVVYALAENTTMLPKRELASAVALLQVTNSTKHFSDEFSAALKDEFEALMKIGALYVESQGGVEKVRGSLPREGGDLGSYEDLHRMGTAGFQR